MWVQNVTKMIPNKQNAYNKTHQGKPKEIVGS